MIWLDDSLLIHVSLPDENDSVIRPDSSSSDAKNENSCAKIKITEIL
jgi:hypothetical protein